MTMTIVYSHKRIYIHWREDVSSGKNMNDNTCVEISCIVLNTNYLYLTPIICKDQKIYYRAQKRHVADFDEIWSRGVF